MRRGDFGSLPPGDRLIHKRMRDRTLYKLSESPLIVAGSFGTHEAAARIPRGATFIYHNAGWIRPRNLWRYVKIARQFRGKVRIIFATNEPSEARWLRLAGLDAVCTGQNMHVRENFFVPHRSITKDIDAVYTAQMSPFKRLELAGNIRNLFVITYQPGDSEWDLHSYAPALSHARFNERFITKEKVREIYQRSRVGLALSKFEGAMWASGEYLLCGLPVVSTVNRGGRDRYFEPWYATTVAADRGAIAAAVERFTKELPDADLIRQTVIGKMNKDRSALLALMKARLGMKFCDDTEEINRIWGGVPGIENHAIPTSDAETAFI